MISDWIILTLHPLIVFSVMYRPARKFSSIVVLCQNTEGIVVLYITTIFNDWKLFSVHIFRSGYRVGLY